MGIVGANNQNLQNLATLLQLAHQKPGTGGGNQTSSGSGGGGAVANSATGNSQGASTGQTNSSSTTTTPTTPGGASAATSASATTTSTNNNNFGLGNFTFGVGPIGAPGATSSGQSMAASQNGINSNMTAMPHAGAVLSAQNANTTASLFNGAGLIGFSTTSANSASTPHQNHQTSPNYYHINSTATTNLVDPFTNLTINSMNGTGVSNPSKVS